MIRVTMVSQSANEIEARYRDYSIRLSRENPSSNWYIQVQDKDGCYSYDGYWRDSEYKPVRSAIEEAIKGSRLLC